MERHIIKWPQQKALCLYKLKEQILNIKKMENKINVAELLKDCPKGMELDCLLCNSPIALEGVAVNESTYPIKVVCKDGFIHVLTKYGELYNHDDAKCVIFPKGKTTWEGFQRPFKDGDIVATNTGWIGITTGGEAYSFIPTYCVIKHYNEFEAYNDIKEEWQFHRLATEEEKQKLFKAIKDNGYKWNAETKTLEKLVMPKFKVGQKIKIESGSIIEIEKITDYYYMSTTGWKFYIKDQDKYELVPNKFDITTFKPFDKVLTRIKKCDVWGPDFFGYYKDGWFHCSGHIAVHHCIPYENNEHLLGKTDDCDDFYKTWK